MPVASSTDAVSATVAAAAARSPQNTSTGVRALRASASSLSVPVSRAISTLECDSEYACSSSQISRATTQPCHSQRSRSLAEASLAGEPLHRLPAERDGRVVVVGEGDQRVQQQVRGRRLAHPVGAARRGRPSATSGTPTLPLSLAPNSAAENASTYVSRATRDVQRLEPAGGGQQERGRVGASAGDERQLGAQQVDPRALELVERPGLGRGQQAASRGERAGLDAGLRGRQRTRHGAAPGPGSARRRAAGTPPWRRRRREPAPGRPTARARRRRPRPVLLPPGRGATRGDRRRRPDRSPRRALRARAAGCRAARRGRPPSAPADGGTGRAPRSPAAPQPRRARARRSRCRASGPRARPAPRRPTGSAAASSISRCVASGSSPTRRR